MVQPELKNDLSKEMQRAKTPRSCRLMTQFEVINAIYDSKLFSKIKLTAGARLVLISLARHYNPLRQDSFPSYSCIAQHTGVSKKSVERAIKELCEKGLISYTTEKVNHYRFTDLFFGVVKMTIDYRQNDGSGYRQNVALTNNPEKINKKEKKGFFKFLGGLLRGGEEENEARKKGTAPQTSQYAEVVQEEMKSECQKESGFNGARAEKIVESGSGHRFSSGQIAINAVNTANAAKDFGEKEDTSADCGMLASDTRGMDSESGMGSVGAELNLSAGETASAARQTAEQIGENGATVDYERYSQSNSYGEYRKSTAGAGKQAQGAQWALSARQGGGKYYGSPSPQKKASDGGGSRVPSAEETLKYLNEMRNARQFACCPLEFEEEHARRWYKSLNPLLKTSVMAKKVAEKYNL